MTQIREMGAVPAQLDVDRYAHVRGTGYARLLSLHTSQLRWLEQLGVGHPSEVAQDDELLQQWQALNADLTERRALGQAQAHVYPADNVGFVALSDCTLISLEEFEAARARGWEETA